MQEMQGTQFRFQGQEDPLEEVMATHSRILAQRIPWTEEPGGLQSMGLQRVRYNWRDWASTTQDLDNFMSGTRSGRPWRVQSGVKVPRSVVCCCLGALLAVPQKASSPGRWEGGPGLFQLGRCTTWALCQVAKKLWSPSCLQPPGIVPLVWEEAGNKEHSGRRLEPLHVSSSTIPYPAAHLWLFTSSKAGFPALKMKGSPFPEQLTRRSLAQQH